MSASGRARGPRVVVVTGGGGGIGAAVAEELGRAGDLVVTVDPLVTLDGAERMDAVDETTADRIVAAGGRACASGVSVTDRPGVTELFRSLRDEHGRLDAVVNVAGITRPTSFAAGTEEDWRAVLSVHLEGYRNVLDASLPIMAEQGHGRVLGVTSGSGWRAADTGAYGCAKRAVASLTWQLGRCAPAGIVVNAMSPIAVTRMVTAALERQSARQGGAGGSAAGGLSLGSLPEPDELGPLGAHLVGEDLDWSRGQVVFAGGSEVALIEQPRLLEVLCLEGPGPFGALVDAFAAGALVPAGRSQSSTGGANPRFRPDLGGEAPAPAAARASAACVVVTDVPDRARSLCEALGARGVRTTVLDAGRTDSSFEAAASALAGAVGAGDDVGAVVVSLRGRPPVTGAPSWRAVLADHDGVADGVLADAAWLRATTDRATELSRPVRVVTLTEAVTAGGRSRAQAVGQLARSSRAATDGQVSAFPVSIEDVTSAGEVAAAQLTAHLVCSPDADELSGAALVAGGGWIGLRSHPRPSVSLALGGPAIPSWMDDVLREVVDGPPPLEER